MRILCKNYSCPYNTKIKPEPAIRRKYHYVPFDDDLYKGECSVPEKVVFEDASQESRDSIFRIAECVGVEGDAGVFICKKVDCASNTNGCCIKEQVHVDKVASPKDDGVRQKRDYWGCTNYNQSKVNGHIDLMSTSRVKTDWITGTPTPQGGQIQENLKEI
jgi:hypothetical protein